MTMKKLTIVIEVYVAGVITTSEHYVNYNHSNQAYCLDNNVSELIDSVNRLKLINRHNNLSIKVFMELSLNKLLDILDDWQ